MSAKDLSDPKLMKSSSGSDVSSLQLAIKERDQQISAMQSTISRLEMKNKEYSAY